MSVSGSDLTISKNFFAGMVSAPGLVTVTAQAYLEIGRDKRDLLGFGFHQDIGENGNRIFSFHDSLKKLQFSQEVVLADDDFHVCADLEKSGLRAPAVP